MKLTKEQEETIIKLNNLGVPKTKIMEVANCSRTAVYNCIDRYNHPKIDPMINKKFGKLTVIDVAEKREELRSRCLRYKCKCDCGNEIEVDGNALRTGHTQSCGCLRKENIYFKNLTGQRFGKLTALYIIDSANNRKVWHCVCDCGNECNVDSKSLISGHTKSCGCLHSYKEVEIENILNQFKINFIKEYTFSDLRGKRNPLRFDFAIIQNDNIICLIEYQGNQHFDMSNNWHTKQLEESDIKKKEYCNINNIPLYELTKEDNLEERMKEILIYHGYKL